MRPRTLALVGAVVLVFLVPSEDSVTLPAAGTLARLVGIGAFGLGVLAVALMGRLRRPTLGWMAMVAWVALTAIGLLWSIDPDETRTRTWTYAQLAAMVWLLGEVAPEPREQRLLMGAYVAGAFVSIGATWRAFLAGASVDAGRYAASGFNPNDLAAILALGIPMAWRIGLEARSRLARTVGLAYPAVAALTVLLTASRGGAVFTLCALLVVPLTWRSLPAAPRAAVVVCAAVGLALAPAIVPAASIERVLGTADEVASGTLNARTDIWTAGALVFRERPFLGFGAGAFQLGVLPVLGAEYDAHNVYVGLLVDHGALGFLPFLAMLGIAAHSVWRMQGIERATWGVLLVVLLVVFLSTNWEWRKQTWLVLGLAFARSTLR